jgi:hypothetical protein
MLISLYIAKQKARYLILDLSEICVRLLWNIDFLEVGWRRLFKGLFMMVVQG